MQQRARQLRQRCIVVPGGQPLQHGSQWPQEARVVRRLHERRRDLLHQPAPRYHSLGANRERQPDCSIPAQPADAQTAECGVWANRASAGAWVDRPSSSALAMLLTASTPSCDSTPLRSAARSAQKPSSARGLATVPSTCHMQRAAITHACKPLAVWMAYGPAGAHARRIRRVGC